MPQPHETDDYATGDPTDRAMAVFSMIENLHPAWHHQANCRSVPTPVMFPTMAAGVEQAKAICEGCPVQEPCLETALKHSADHGVWGGTSERQRHRMRGLTGKLHRSRSETALDEVLRDGQWHPRDQVVTFAAARAELHEGYVRRALGNLKIDEETDTEGVEWIRRSTA